MARVVVDTNIIFSALVSSQSTFAEILLRSDHEFFVCEMALVEIFKHKNKIAKYSRLSDDDLARLYHILLRRITLFKEDLISLDAFLWTGDKKLKVGLQAKGFKKLFEQAK